MSAKKIEMSWSASSGQTIECDAKIIRIRRNGARAAQMLSAGLGARTEGILATP